MACKYGGVRTTLLFEDTKVLVITNPGNPTANVFTKEELEEMVRITSENDVVIISDEVHSDLLL